MKKSFNQFQDKIIRHGAYGVVLQDAKILLTQKKTGPYQGLWGLPGGAIEFGETPEETLKRELLEESSLEILGLELLNIATATGEYNKNGEPYGFHQIGLIYRVVNWIKQLSVTPEEENRWASLNNITHQELTPFARHAIANLPTNKTWRPNNSIRGKVIGLAKHENRLLVCEVLNDDGVLKGWSPIGGGIEFGETAQEALKREIQEELGCHVSITSDPIICENIFEHHGVKGHEIIFAFPIRLEDQAIYGKNRFQIHEYKGSSHWVEWIPIEHFEQGRAVLFPSILTNKIAAI
ncbi:NUDIX domain-containing protein [Candidatus Protochlamydia sp. R18]|uniref:NUDIX domain-containing protein n=1 Tax=Candidatus Protochlamydia sp. R18 TaxID=1353977 RepID=UPI000693C28C|nr:NUDIX domain-containing protein [Candidatus Protochlamydia sp. R18]